MEKMYQYWWSLLVPVIYALLLLQNLNVNNQPFSDLSEWTPLFALGVLQGLAIVWLVRQMPTKEYKITAIVGAVFFIFGGFAVGGLTGQEGVLLNTTIATAVYTFVAWLVGRKTEGAGRRTWIALGIFVAIWFLLPPLFVLLFG